MAQTINRQILVSTHSRPKAAGRNLAMAKRGILSFNTQPPEGGWEMLC